jgi:hypothetical protein
MAASAWTNLEADLRSGRLVKMAVKWPVAFRVAVHLSERHSVTIGTRSLDILHIASAKAIRAQSCSLLMYVSAALRSWLVW